LKFYGASKAPSISQIKFMKRFWGVEKNLIQKRKKLNRFFLKQKKDGFYRLFLKFL
jgi:hypothetical protein